MIKDNHVKKSPQRAKLFNGGCEVVKQTGPAWEQRSKPFILRWPQNSAVGRTLFVYYIKNTVKKPSQNRKEFSEAFEISCVGIMALRKYLRI